MSKLTAIYADWAAAAAAKLPADSLERIQLETIVRELRHGFTQIVADYIDPASVLISTEGVGV